MHPNTGSVIPLMDYTSFRSDDLAVRSVNRAVGDLRRGVPVVVAAEGGGRAVVLAAETASAATWQEFLAESAGAPVLLLARSRAADLGAGFAHGHSELAAQSISALALDAGRMDIAGLRALADPTRAQGPAPGLAPAAHPPAGCVPAMALAKLARLLPAVVIAALADGAPGAPSGLLEVAEAAIAAYPAETACRLERAADARVPLDEAEDVRIVAFRPPDGGTEHLAILVGRPEQAEAPMVRIHSECFTGDLLGSRRCDCGPQLHQALRRMAEAGAGIILYMAQEGRGIGLVNKLRAYTLQDGAPGRPGLDTLDANRALGYGADERSFAAAATMLRNLGVGRVRLLTNNPAKVASLAAHGIEVAGRLSHAIAANGENDGYLETKARRFGHLLG